MKKITLSLAALAACMYWTACSTETKYTDLDTGETITVKKDDATGEYVNAATGKPVRLYVQNTDTIEGHTGKVVNNQLTRTEEGRYMLASEMGTTMPSGTTNMDTAGMSGNTDMSGTGSEMNGAMPQEGTDMTTTDNGGTGTGSNGYKVKNGEYKEKNDGDVKIKEGDTKIKVDRDGDVKVKENGHTYKKDGKTGEVKVK